MATSIPDSQPVGYCYLKEKYKLNTYPHWVQSRIGTARKSIQQTTGRSIEIYPKKSWPGDNDIDHLNFALNREGLYMELLAKILPVLCRTEIEGFISSKPTGANPRRLWYLYEVLTGDELALENLSSKVGYIPLMDPKLYYVGKDRVSMRHRVKVNLLGTPFFSPFVRRTDELKNWESKNLQKSCQDFINSISPDLFDRVRDYLYTKETKSSFAIERLKPNAQRAEKFARLLSGAGESDYLNKKALVDLQTGIVESEYALNNYRHSGGEQVYVGESISFTEQRVHFVAPRQDDISELMKEYLIASHLILESTCHPIIAATLISYVFVFLHPFPDGNGRIHRFLIHHVLAKMKFVPEGVIFPVSAIMLNRSRDYDESLERFSRDLLPLIDYEMDERSRMTVLNETDAHYRYIDMTPICGFLFSFVEETIEEEMPAEVDFLINYDKARAEMRDVLDMPNRIADLFLRLCLQNEGKLSKAKRKLPEYIDMDDSVIEHLEEVVRNSFGL